MKWERHQTIYRCPPEPPSATNATADTWYETLLFHGILGLGTFSPLSSANSIIHRSIIAPCCLTWIGNRNPYSDTDTTLPTLT